MRTHIKLVSEGDHRFPPKWRIAVSGRPGVWLPQNTARCHEYRLLARFGEARVRYVLGTEIEARELLAEMAKITKIRRDHRDELDLPLLSMNYERNRT
jgi:hypothetical protein